MWEERERRRVEILAAVDQAEASFARGERRRSQTTVEAEADLDDIWFYVAGATFTGGAISRPFFPTNLT